MAIREGRWDCESCGTIGNLGSQKDCPHCGAGVPDGDPYYLPEGEPPVSEPNKLRDAQAGPDWVCEHCEASNQGYRVNCRKCSAPKGSSPIRQTENHSNFRAAPPRVDPIESEPSPVTSYRRGYSSSAPSSSGELPGVGSSLIAPFAGIAAVVLVVIGIWFAFFRTQEAPITVSGFTWERTINIEQYKTVREDDWIVPNGGRVINQYPAIHHYIQVLDHYEDEAYTESHQVQNGTYICGHNSLGNGYFEDVYCPKFDTVYETKYHPVPKYRPQPVYQTKYTYDIEKWVFERTAKTVGTDHEAYWPGLELTDKERESGRVQTYTVIFLDQKEQKRPMVVTYEQWVTYQIGEKYSAEFNAVGMMLAVKSK